MPVGEQTSYQTSYQAEKQAINQRIQIFQPGTIFRFKDAPLEKFRIVGYNTLGEHIIYVPEHITNLEDMNGWFDVIWIMDPTIEKVN